MGDPSADDEGGRSQPAMRSALSLRPYQHEAVDAVQAAVERGVQRPMVVLPTGCGKNGPVRSPDRPPWRQRASARPL